MACGCGSAGAKAWKVRTSGEEDVWFDDEPSARLHAARTGGVVRRMATQKNRRAKA